MSGHASQVETQIVSLLRCSPEGLLFPSAGARFRQAVAPCRGEQREPGRTASVQVAVVHVGGKSGQRPVPDKATKQVNIRSKAQWAS
jgi:hypothetical protein